MVRRERHARARRERSKRLLGRMDPPLVARLEADQDTGRFFHAHLPADDPSRRAPRSTGGSRTPSWVQEWDVVFADLYLDALGAAAPRRGPPALAHRLRHRPPPPPLAHVLLGMNAHINYDLPQALIAVVPPRTSATRG